ncbi:MAG: DUF2231 domain-containing protein [Cytophagaceae bacterium]|nr:DUF2231 domain-containing protein [Cytophagaceae bacterium]
MIKYHEAIVHFPIALLLTALIFCLIGTFYKRGLFKEIIFWNLVLGVLATGGAIYTGFQEQEQIKDLQLREILDIHRRNAYILGIIFLCLLIWMGWRKKGMRNLEYFAWVSFYIIGSFAIGYQGYMGHEMSAKMDEYEIREASKPVPQKKELDYGWNF